MSNVMEVDFGIETETIDVDMTITDDSSDLSMEIDDTKSGGTYDYNKLINKPSINHTELVGNYNEIDPTVPDWAKTDKPEEYSETEIEFIWRSIFK